MTHTKTPQPPARPSLNGWRRLFAVGLALVALASCTPAPTAAPAWVLVVGDSMVFGDARFGVTGFGPTMDRYTSAPIEWVGAGGENPITGPHKWLNATKAAVARRGRAPSVVVIEACCSSWTTATSAAWRTELRAIAAAAGAKRVVAVTVPRPVVGSWYWQVDPSVVGAQTDLLREASSRGWETVDLFHIWPLGTAGIHASDGLHFSVDAAQQTGAVVANKVGK